MRIAVWLWITPTKIGDEHINYNINTQIDHNLRTTFSSRFSLSPHSSNVNTTQISSN